MSRDAEITGDIVAWLFLFFSGAYGMQPSRWRAPVKRWGVPCRPKPRYWRTDNVRLMLEGLADVRQRVEDTQEAPP